MGGSMSGKATPPTGTDGALAGVRVLDLTRLLPGAFCTQLLGDLGADVIKIEQPGKGDYNRSFEPIHRKESGSFLLLNRNKRSLTLNLKSEEGRDIFLKLLADADVVVEGFRPGVMDRLKLNYDVLREHNPKVVMCAISGFGQTGPLREASGHDLNYVALTGALQLFAEKGRAPIVPGLSIADIGGGSLMAVYGILAALHARARSGEGQYVDVSMMDGLVSWLTYHAADFLFGGIEPRGGERNFIGAAPCYNIYCCKDGKYLSLGIIEPQFWDGFCKLIARHDLLEHQWPQGDAADRQFAELAALFMTRPRDEWAALFVASDVPAAPVNSMQEAFAHPQMQAREMLQQIDHPVEGRIPQLGFPVKFSATPARMIVPPPTLGQHNAEILGALGYSAEQIERLVSEHTI
jgi:crotonobetainyl-CoA:carnitine CoA-transferase CaiB-like acyl-CoA transferase